MGIAIANIKFMWDTDKLRYRNSGADLFKDIQAFWAAHGISAELVETIGTSGERIVMLSEIEVTQIDKKNLMQSDGKPQPVAKRLDQLAKKGLKVK